MQKDADRELIKEDGGPRLPPGGSQQILQSQRHLFCVTTTLPPKSPDTERRTNTFQEARSGNWARRQRYREMAQTKHVQKAKSKVLELADDEHVTIDAQESAFKTS